MTARSLSIYLTFVGIALLLIVVAMLNHVVTEQKDLEYIIPLMIVTSLLVFVNLKASILTGKLGKLSLYEVKLLKEHASYVIVIKYVFSVIAIFLFIVLLINAIAGLVYVVGVFASMAVAIFLTVIVIVTLGLVLLDDRFKYFQPIEDTYETITYVPRLIFNFERKVFETIPFVKHFIVFSPFVIVIITSVFALFIIIRKKHLVAVSVSDNSNDKVALK